MFEFLGGLLGGLGSFVGGVSKFFPQGGGSSWQQEQAMQFAREQLQFQRDAARHGIQWRVSDAKESGVHPLYAIGAPSFSPSPVSFPVGDPPQGVDWGGALSQMSQGVGRAISATQTKAEREITELDLALATQGAASRQLDLEMKRTQLEIMQTQLRKAQGQIGPPLPGPVPPTAATNEAKVEPNPITSSQGDVPFSAAGPVAPAVQWRQAPDGTVFATPEKNLQMDDMGSPGWLPWMYRNHILPHAQQTLGVDTNAKPPKHMLPRGFNDWVHQPDGSWKPIWKEPSNWRRSGHGAWRHRDTTWTGAP